jgi:hypothetical protein
MPENAMEKYLEKIAPSTQAYSTDIKRNKK